MRCAATLDGGVGYVPADEGEADLRGLVTTSGPPWNDWLKTRLEPEAEARGCPQTQGGRVSAEEDMVTRAGIEPTTPGLKVPSEGESPESDGV